jgi:carbonic anhydrase
VSVPIFVNLAELIGLNMIDDFWFYLGSATIPPCSDSKINWVISRKKYAISKEQNDTLTTLLSWYKP